MKANQTFSLRRALGGLVNNLKRMRTAGPYRDVCVELCAMRTAALAARG